MIELVGVAGKVDSGVGDEVALPGDGVGEGETAGLAPAVGVCGIGLALPGGRVGVGTDVVATSGGVAVSDGAGAGGVPEAGVSDGVASRPGEEESSATGVPVGSAPRVGAGEAPL